AKTSGSDIGISITGVAGPGGGTDEKPVGLVYIGLHYKGKTETFKLNWSGERERIRARAVTKAFEILWKLLSAL
ncbi:MAG: CinA family protein, partial [Defluviitaleaceae bacterium]|nr:CinA family protein [Defluviitaleaceae bacterium]